MGEKRNSIGEAWAGSREVRICVDGENPMLAHGGQYLRARRQQIQPEFRSRAIHAVATRHDHNYIWARLHDLLS